MSDEVTQNLCIGCYTVYALSYQTKSVERVIPDGSSVLLCYLTLS